VFGRNQVTTIPRKNLLQLFVSLPLKKNCNKEMCVRIHAARKHKNFANFCLEAAG